MKQLSKNLKISFAALGVALTATAIVVPSVVCTQTNHVQAKVQQDSNWLRMAQPADFFSFGGFFNHVKSEWHHFTSEVHHDFDKTATTMKQHFHKLQQEIAIKSVALKNSFNHVEHEFQQWFKQAPTEFEHAKTSMAHELNRMSQQTAELLKSAEAATVNFAQHAPADAHKTIEQLRTSVNSILTNLGLNSVAGLKHDGHVIARATKAEAQHLVNQLKSLVTFFKDLQKSVQNASYDRTSQVWTLPWQVNHDNKTIIIPLKFFSLTNHVLSQQQKNQYLLNDFASVINRLDLLNVSHTKLADLGTVLTLIKEFDNKEVVKNNYFVEDMGKVLEYYDYMTGPKSPLNNTFVKTAVKALLTAYPEAGAMLSFMNLAMNGISHGLHYYSEASNEFNTIMQALNHDAVINTKTGTVTFPISLGSGETAAHATITMDGFNKVSVKEANQQLANCITAMFDVLHLSVKGTKYVNIPHEIQAKEAWVQSFSTYLNQKLVQYENGNMFEAWMANKELKPVVTQITKMVNQTISAIDNEINFDPQQGKIGLTFQVGEGVNVAYAHLDIYGFNK
ncbi:hypothetical protein [Ureaplasma ceti]|uniref:Uncharacterized protein n=1 Tax=Ureaplasma ceti TaxID=3119530 RepID=A0ABP9U4U5_9BACT